jgi:hypothetical protein
VTPSPRTGAIQLALAALAIVLALVAGTPADAAAVSRATFAAKAAQAPSKKAAKRVVVRFKVRGLARRVKRATLVLHGRRVARASVRVRKVGKRPTVVGHWAPRKRSKKLRSKAQRRTVRIDVTRAVKGNGDVALALTSSDRGALAAAAGEAKLDIVLASGAGSAGGGSSEVSAKEGSSSSSSSKGSSSSSSSSKTSAAAKGSSSSTSKLAPPAGTTRPAGIVTGIWVSPAELAARPLSGAAWDGVKRAADGSAAPAIANQDSDHDVQTMAAALVYARTGAGAYRDKAAAGIASAIGTEAGGRTLALGRNLPGYVIAADLIGLGGYDGGLDARFRGWLAGVRTETLSGDTLISTHELRPNNWGTHAGAARVAADAYLGDTADLDRAARVFHGWLGDRGAYAGFKYGDLSYQADPSAPVGVNPAGAAKDGVSVDGALPDDMRRGCSFQPVPCHTDYAWEAMQGAVVQAELLARRGYDAWGWSDRALLRAATYLRNLDAQFGGWWAQADDTWQPFLLNKAYAGAGLPQGATASIGKNMAFTDWTLGG